MRFSLPLNKKKSQFTSVFAKAKRVCASERLAPTSRCRCNNDFYCSYVHMCVSIKTEAWPEGQINGFSQSSRQRVYFFQANMDALIN